VNDDLSTLPGCIGYYGRPSQGSACETCEIKDLCAKVKEDFVPKSVVLRVYERLEKILMEVG
jgi:hypothetical protein